MVGRAHDDVGRPRESPGVVALPGFLRQSGNDGKIMDHGE
jgi:hypothetical protein